MALEGPEFKADELITAAETAASNAGVVSDTDSLNELLSEVVEVRTQMPLAFDVRINKDGSTSKGCRLCSMRIGATSGIACR